MPPKKKLEDRSKYVKNAKPIGEATSKELKQALGFAKAHAERKGKAYLGSEFSSYLMEYLVKQGTLYYNIHWVWEGFCRNELGKLQHKPGVENKKGKARAVANSYGRVSLTKLVKASDVGSGEAEHALTDPKPQPDKPDLIKEMSEKFEKSERTAMVLHYKWEFTLDEIAECIGVTRERVRQILVNVDNKMKWMATTGRLDGKQYTRAGINAANTR